MNQKLVHLYDRLLLAVDGIVARRKARAKKGVLFVKLDHIGDFVIWLSNARAFREFYAGEKITLMVNPAVADLAFTQRIADEIWAIDPNRLRRNIFYSLVIHPTYSRKIFVGDSIVRVSQASQRIGFDGDLSNQTALEKRIADTWYTQLIPVEPDVVSELDRNGVLTSQCIGKVNTLAPPWIESSERERATKNIDYPYFVVVPGASNVGRQWPIESFAAVTDKLYKKTKWRPMLLGSSNEVDLCKDLEAKLSGVSCINLAGSTDIIRMVALIRHAKFVIANESSAVHIAAAVKTPSVCILGGGHYGRFVPYPAWVKEYAPIPIVHMMGCFSCNWRCAKDEYKGVGAFPCVDAVDARVVEGRIFAALVN
jgi:ADP-heptose:LPS heptosyltransferase